LILAHHGEAPGEAYAQYRKLRLGMLEGYCLNMLRENRGLKRAVGVGIDTSSKVTGRQGGTEDVYALEVSAWTPELDKRAQDLKEMFGLLNPNNVKLAIASADEFPPIAASGPAEASIARSIKVRPSVPEIKPDLKWPKMWRVHLPDGQITDMTNFTRAKDAARTLSRPS